MTVVVNLVANESATCESRLMTGQGDELETKFPKLSQGTFFGRLDDWDGPGRLARWVEYRTFVIEELGLKPTWSQANPLILA